MTFDLTSARMFPTCTFETYSSCHIWIAVTVFTCCSLYQVLLSPLTVILLFLVILSRPLNCCTFSPLLSGMVPSLFLQAVGYGYLWCWFCFNFLLLFTNSISVYFRSSCRLQTPGDFTVHWVHCISFLNSMQTPPCLTYRYCEPLTNCIGFKLMSFSSLGSVENYEQIIGKKNTWCSDIGRCV